MGTFLPSIALVMGVLLAAACGRGVSRRDRVLMIVAAFIHAVEVLGLVVLTSGPVPAIGALIVPMTVIASPAIKLLVGILLAAATAGTSLTGWRRWSMGVDAVVQMLPVLITLGHLLLVVVQRGL